MNRMTRPSAFSTSLSIRLQAVLELATVLGTRHERAHVKLDEVAVAQGRGHVARDDALGDALDDGGLAHAGLADEHGVVLGTAGKDLNGAADLLSAADDRVELARAGEVTDVATILLEGLELGLRVRRSHAVVAAELRIDSSMRSRVTPAAAKIRPASPLSSASAMSRCSVTTKLSSILEAFFSARSSTRVRSLPSCC